MDIIQQLIWIGVGAMAGLATAIVSVYLMRSRKNNLGALTRKLSAETQSISSQELRDLVEILKDEIRRLRDLLVDSNKEIGKLTALLVKAKNELKEEKADGK